MTRHFLLTAALITACCYCNAQIHLSEWGLSGGITISSEHGSSIPEKVKSSLTGVSTGGHVTLKTSDHFSIKVALQYEQNGWAYRSFVFGNAAGTGLAKGDVIYKLNYLNLPVLAEYSVGNKIRFNADAGLFIGALLNNKFITKLYDPLNSGRVTTTTDRSDDRKQVNYGIVVGAGAQMPLTSKVALTVNVRDAIGVAGINKGTSFNHSSRMNTASVLAGISVSLLKRK